MALYQHILVGLDLSKESKLVIEKAKHIAQQNNAKISVAHIVEPLFFAYGSDIPMDMSETQKTIEKQALLHLNKLLDEHAITASNTDVAVGATASEIHRLANEYACDLIIVGSHGRHGLSLLLGSTANGVLHGALQDVLAVRV